jgi:hypothetical protein
MAYTIPQLIKSKEEREKEESEKQERKTLDAIRYLNSKDYKLQDYLNKYDWYTRKQASIRTAKQEQ